MEWRESTSTKQHYILSYEGVDAVVVRWNKWCKKWNLWILDKTEVSTTEFYNTEAHAKEVAEAYVEFLFDPIAAKILRDKAWCEPLFPRS